MNRNHRGIRGNVNVNSNVMNSSTKSLSGEEKYSLILTKEQWNELSEPQKKLWNDLQEKADNQRKTLYERFLKDLEIEKYERPIAPKPYDEGHQDKQLWRKFSETIIRI